MFDSLTSTGIVKLGDFPESRDVAIAATCFGNFIALDVYDSRDPDGLRYTVMNITVTEAQKITGALAFAIKAAEGAEDEDE